MPKGKDSATDPKLDEAVILQNSDILVSYLESRDSSVLFELISTLKKNLSYPFNDLTKITDEIGQKIEVLKTELVVQESQSDKAKVKAMINWFLGIKEFLDYLKDKKNET